MDDEGDEMNEQLIDLLSDLLDAADDGVITAGEVAAKPIKKIRRELKRWLREEDGTVLVSGVEPLVVAILSATLVMLDPRSSDSERRLARISLIAELLGQVL